MTPKQFIDHLEYFTSDMVKTAKKKNSDYAAGADPFANFRVVEKLGISSVEAGILTRMSDKLSRLISFTKKGSLEVKDESIHDTLKDLANYAAILSAYYEEVRKGG